MYLEKDEIDSCTVICGWFCLDLLVIMIAVCYICRAEYWFSAKLQLKAVNEQKAPSRPKSMYLAYLGALFPCTCGKTGSGVWALYTRNRFSSILSGQRALVDFEENVIFVWFDGMGAWCQLRVTDQLEDKIGEKGLSGARWRKEECRICFWHLKMTVPWVPKVKCARRREVLDRLGPTYSDRGHSDVACDSRDSSTRIVQRVGGHAGLDDNIFVFFWPILNIILILFFFDQYWILFS